MIIKRNILIIIIFPTLCYTFLFQLIGKFSEIFHPSLRRRRRQACQQFFCTRMILGSWTSESLQLAAFIYLFSLFCLYICSYFFLIQLLILIITCLLFFFLLSLMFSIFFFKNFACNIHLDYKKVIMVYVPLLYYQVCISLFDLPQNEDSL